MSKKDRKRREAARRQKQQRQAKVAAAKESAEEEVLEEAPEPEDEASRAKRRAEQKRDYEKTKRAKARGDQSPAPFLWGGGVVAVLAAVIFGGFLLLSGGGDDGGSNPTPAPTIDPRIADLPIDRTITIETDDDGQNINPRYVPNTISGQAGEVIEILVTNVGSVAHNLRFPGLDGEYNTRDDWFVDPGTIQPGETGRVVVKIDEPASYPFRCDFHVLDHLGTLTLR